MYTSARFWSATTVFLACAVLMFFLSGSGKSIDRAPDPVQVATGCTEFSIDLYGKLKAEKGNIFCSPFSIWTALCMTYAGAKGETAAQMEKALHFYLGQDRLHKAVGTMLKNLNARSSKKKDSGEGWGTPFKLSVANALWGQTDYGFKAGFRKILDSEYGAGLRETDFIKDDKKAREAINKWVTDNTNRKIKKLVDKEHVNSETRFVITNAIYFKASWASPFSEAFTEERPFHISKSKKVKTATMQQCEYFRYMATDRFFAVELPYLGGEICMLVVAPKKTDGIGELEKFLSWEEYVRLNSKLKSTNINLFLPKFKIRAKFNLAEVLQKMGMKDAFAAASSDFTGIADKPDLYIGAVVHEAFVDVHEKGTEAAAATAVCGLESEPEDEPIDIKFDRPFMFFIRDKKSDCILFAGRVADPTKKP